LSYAGTVDPAGATLLARLDGTRPLGGLLDELAAELGLQRADEIDGWLAITRRLLESGLLEPA
jgi:hypothetical protein